MQGNPSQLSKQRKVRLMIIFGWVWSVCLSFPPLLGWGQFSPESNGMRWDIDNLPQSEIKICELLQLHTGVEIQPGAGLQYLIVHCWLLPAPFHHHHHLNIKLQDHTGGKEKYILFAKLSSTWLSLMCMQHAQCTHNPSGHLSTLFSFLGTKPLVFTQSSFRKMFLKIGTFYY